MWHLLSKGNAVKRWLRPGAQPHVERIVLTGDVFRTVTGEAGQLKNVRWLSRRFRPLLMDLTALPVEERFRLNAADEGKAVIRKWFALLGEPVSLEAWARSFWRTPPRALINAMARDYRGSLVVSVEMSPLMQGVFDALDVPWIDVGISPRRFLPDLAVSLKASRHFRTDAAPDRYFRGAKLKLPYSGCGKFAEVRTSMERQCSSPKRLRTER